MRHLITFACSFFDFSCTKRFLLCQMLRKRNWYSLELLICMISTQQNSKMISTLNAPAGSSTFHSTSNNCEYIAFHTAKPCMMNQSRTSWWQFLQFFLFRFFFTGLDTSGKINKQLPDFSFVKQLTDMFCCFGIFHTSADFIVSVIDIQNTKAFITSGLLNPVCSVSVSDS